MLALLVPLAFPRPAQTVPTYDPARSYAPLVEAVAPAVVLVRTRTRTSTGDDSGSGSGFLIGEDGLVLTANHVIQDVSALTVKTSDGVEHQAVVVGSDGAMDIAVLRLKGDGAPYPWLDLAKDPPRVGDRVLALGNPLGLGATVTAGIVSGIDRDLALDRYWRSDAFIQTDAAINQGNSGGPLVDLDGRVLGMNTSIIAGANTVGFAIPSHVLARVVPELTEHGKVLRGFLGLDSNKLTEQAAAKYDVPDGGALVYNVLKGSPADAAGLRVWDVIVAVDGHKVASGADLLGLVGIRRPGEVVVIELLRKGKRQTVEVTLGERPSEP
ncbi:MAG: trypsin-like peptidase domain-containing protein [Alphaproteobacteria bacterium]|nr:trypsin-like peptidase domain-containing protein [Alphaproteobacteria bacterium]